MSKYLITFPSRAMEVAEGEWEQVVEDSHAVVRQAKEAGRVGLRRRDRRGRGAGPGVG